MASSSLAATAQAHAHATRVVAGRAVHLKIYPRPRSIFESRQILGKLEQFGEVVAYRSLRYDVPSPVPNTTLAIYQTPDAAKRLLASAPLRFSVRENPEPPAGPEALVAGLDPAPSSSSDDHPSQPARRDFYITAGPSNFPHAAHIARQRFYGNFVPRPVTIPAEDLTKSVPLAGLATAPGWDGRPLSASEVELRIARKQQKKLVGKKTPMQLYREAMEQSTG